MYKILYAAPRLVKKPKLTCSISLNKKVIVKSPAQRLDRAGTATC
jgi:hypothetical protein